MTPRPTLLYHYTCEHGYKAAKACGSLIPGPEGLLWLTDLEPPAPRLALGLTTYSLACDRMAHVFEVPVTCDVIWWMQYRRRKPHLIAKEFAPGVMPMHWFVSEQPLAFTQIRVTP
jgi:hypothetical protein